MATRRRQRLAILAKTESVYGTDPTPTDALLLTNVALTPIAAQEVQRGLPQAHLGHQGAMLSMEHVVLEGDIELAGSGEAGEPPAWGPIAKACGLSEEIVLDDTTPIAVEYAPVSTGFSSATIYFNWDGVRHILRGVRGNLSLNLSRQAIPTIRVRLLGLLGTITDQSLPSASLEDFITPLLMSAAVTTFSLHGLAAPCHALSIDLGHQVALSPPINVDAVQIMARAATGSATIEADALAAKDWPAIARARTRGALAFSHGTVAGNIIEIDAPAVEIGAPAYGDAQGLLTWVLPLALCPDEGDDEIVITVR